MASDRGNEEMRCPKCGRFSLKADDGTVRCRFCGYELSPGQVDKFRLYQMLKREE